MKTKEEIQIESETVSNGWKELSDFCCRTCNSIARVHPKTNWIWGCLTCNFTTYSVFVYFKELKKS